MKDLARIYVKAGNGGDGSAHLRHEKYAPKGGPDGGDGGRGGDVILVADENLDNLVEFNFQKRFVAKDGEKGYEKRSSGRSLENVEVRIPVGTVVYEIPQELFEADLRQRPIFERVMKERVQVADMTTHGQKFEAAWGGTGGRGNWHFRSATNQTPRNFEPGKPGDEKWLMLELKVVADVGIIGLPNVGKSSLLKALTRANPKIAGYPFTTLEPNLGVMKINDDQSLILVDVPGVVEEAWEGKGIGPWFMRHLERTSTLVHVLAPSSEILADLRPACNALPSNAGRFKIQDVSEKLIGDYRIVRKELEKYGNGLAQKPEIVVVNKMELVEEKDRVVVSGEFHQQTGKDLAWISAASNKVGELMGRLTVPQ